MAPAPKNHQTILMTNLLQKHILVNIWKKYLHQNSNMGLFMPSAYTPFIIWLQCPKITRQFWWQISHKGKFSRIFEGKIFIRILPTTFLQNFYESIYYFWFIAKSIKDADDNHVNTQTWIGLWIAVSPGSICSEKEEILSSATLP